MPNLPSAVDQLAEQFWDRFLEISPLNATLNGDDLYDDRLPDPGPEGRAKARDLATWIRDAARAIPDAGLSVEELITRDMLAVKQSLGLDRLKLHEDNLRERLRVALYPTFGEFKIDKTFAVYREQKSMAEMEAICFEKLLEMEDVPEGGGQPQPNGQDDEIQAASTAAEAGAVA